MFELSTAPKPTVTLSGLTVQRSVVAELDATTGAIIDSNFIPVGAIGMALDGDNHLFIGNGDKVGEYDATTGAAINADFITGLSGVWSIAIVPVVPAVPEPSTFVLAALGVAGLAAWRRRRHFARVETA